MLIVTTRGWRGRATRPRTPPPPWLYIFKAPSGVRTCPDHRHPFLCGHLVWAHASDMPGFEDDMPGFKAPSQAPISMRTSGLGTCPDDMPGFNNDMPGFKAPSQAPAFMRTSGLGTCPDDMPGFQAPSQAPFFMRTRGYAIQRPG